MIAGFYGSTQLVLNLFFLMYQIGWIIPRSRELASSPPIQSRYLAEAWRIAGFHAVFVIAGACLLYAAIPWWKGRWRRALTFSLIGLILLLLTMYAMAYAT